MPVTIHRILLIRLKTKLSMIRLYRYYCNYYETCSNSLAIASSRFAVRITNVWLSMRYCIISNIAFLVCPIIRTIGNHIVTALKLLILLTK